MQVYSLSGLHVADDAGQLLALLRERHAGSFGVLWISPDRYPMLTVGIHGDLAWLWFVREEGHAGFLSQGELPAGSPDVEFMNDDLQMEPRPATCVIPLHAAEGAALEFLQTHELPAAVEWLEL